LLRLRGHCRSLPESPRDVTCIAAIGDWLHSQAAHAAQDFARFNEDWFWLELQSLDRRFPRRDLTRYWLYFEFAGLDETRL
jgi:hypothetical protein